MSPGSALALLWSLPASDQGRSVIAGLWPHTGVLIHLETSQSFLQGLLTKSIFPLCCTSLFCV
nr:FT005 [Homo sapiens]